MKILSYNIDHGGREGKNTKYRWPKLLSLIRQASPDIVIILEAWGWRKDMELAMFAKKLGYKYYFLSKSNTPHNIALLSHIAPKKVIFHKKGFHHSLLEARYRIKNFPPFTLLGVHLNPHNEEIRYKEIEGLINIFKKNKYAVALGDFNSLSPEDAYNKKKLRAFFKKNKITKFGVNIIETKVIKRLLHSGFIDSIKIFYKNKLQYTVPTKMPTKVKKLLPLRYDYAFTSKNLIPRIHSAKIVKNKYTYFTSDHYPIILEIE